MNIAFGQHLFVYLMRQKSFHTRDKNAIFAGAHKKKSGPIRSASSLGWQPSLLIQNAMPLNWMIQSLSVLLPESIASIKYRLFAIYTYYIQAACVWSSLSLESHWLVRIAQVCHRATMAFCPRMCAAWCHCTWKNDILISVLSEFLTIVRIRIMNFGYFICAEHKISISHQSENNDSIEIVNWYILAGYFRRTYTHKLAKIGFDSVLEWRRDGSLFIPVTMVMRYADCEPIQFVRMHTINDWPEYSIDSHISIGISTVHCLLKIARMSWRTCQNHCYRERNVLQKCMHKPVCSMPCIMWSINSARRFSELSFDLKEPHSRQIDNFVATLHECS